MPDTGPLGRLGLALALLVVLPPAVAEVQSPAAEAAGIFGSASFYGPRFHGRRSASGERFDPKAFSAASNRFPLGAWVAVQRLDNGRCALVRINDRMHGRHRTRIIDVSRAAAEYLGMLKAGVVLVRAAAVADHRAKGACARAFGAEPADPCPDCDREAAQGAALLPRLFPAD